MAATVADAYPRFISVCCMFVHKASSVALKSAEGHPWKPMHGRHRSDASIPDSAISCAVHRGCKHCQSLTPLDHQSSCYYDQYQCQVSGKRTVGAAAAGQPSRLAIVATDSARTCAPACTDHHAQSVWDSQCCHLSCSCLGCNRVHNVRLQAVRDS